MRELGSCAYRVHLDDPEKYYCLHSSVHINGNIVNNAICRYCQERTTECNDPRPTPAISDLATIVEASFAKKIWNFGAAVTAFVSDGMKLVDEETYAARMAVCESCEFRSNNHCAQCGCMLALKASGRAFKCPVGKWETVEQPNPE